MDFVGRPGIDYSHIGKHGQDHLFHSGASAAHGRLTMGRRSRILGCAKPLGRRGAIDD